MIRKKLKIKPKSRPNLNPPKNDRQIQTENDAQIKITETGDPKLSTIDDKLNNAQNQVENQVENQTENQVENQGERQVELQVESSYQLENQAKGQLESQSERQTEGQLECQAERGIEKLTQKSTKENAPQQNEYPQTQNQTQLQAKPETKIYQENGEILTFTELEPVIRKPEMHHFLDHLQNDNSNTSESTSVHNFDHKIPIPPKELQENTNYLKAYNCRKIVKASGNLEKLTQERAKKSNIQDENLSISGDSSANISISSSRTSTKHRMRSTQVKNKLKNMKKDKDGNIILDKAKFPLADLIYVTRHFGKRKTGLQERREKFELDAKNRKLELLKRKELVGAEGEDSEETLNSKKEKTEALDEHETLSTITQLTEDELTNQNKQNLNKINIRQNENGEMVVDSEQSVAYPGVVAFENQNKEAILEEDDIDMNHRYKRCLTKKKPAHCAPQIKARRWQEAENVLFWQALSIVGQDFSLMEYYFKSKKCKRFKNELKSKFHREDKLFSNRVNNCLKKAAETPLKESDFKYFLEGEPSEGEGPSLKNDENKNNKVASRAKIVESNVIL